MTPSSFSSAEDNTPTPRHARFFTEERPFDATKDDCLLDAIQQGVAVLQDCEIRGYWKIATYPDINGVWHVSVERPGGDLFVGVDVRSALREALNAD